MPMAEEKITKEIYVIYREEWNHAIAIMEFGRALNETHVDAIPDHALRTALVKIATQMSMSPLHYKRMNDEAERLKDLAPACPKCHGKMRLIDKPGMKFWGCVKYPDCQGTIDFEQWEKEQGKEGERDGSAMERAPPTREKGKEKGKGKGERTTREGGPPVVKPHDGLSSITIKQMKNELRIWITGGKILGILEVPSEYWKDDDCIPAFYHFMKEHGADGWNEYVKSFKK